MIGGRDYGYRPCFPSTVLDQQRKKLVSRYCRYLQRCLHHSLLPMKSKHSPDKQDEVGWLLQPTSTGVEAIDAPFWMPMNVANAFFRFSSSSPFRLDQRCEAMLATVGIPRAFTSTSRLYRAVAAVTVRRSCIKFGCISLLHPFLFDRVGG
mmetsp:Transcript_34183/g.68935  ORF Transcript_34183/g.68935 Transcript_34183/m.68935 type:complete len:151 (+) Transcript_34183:328-780(+)